MVSASQGAAFDTSVCVFGFFGVVCVCLLCLFGVGPTPLPRLVWVGFILSAPPWPPSPPPRTPGSAGLFHFKSQQSIHVCVWRVEVKKFQENVSFLVKQRKAERGRERGWVGLVSSCHVMSCHVMVRKGFCLSIRSLIMMLQNPHHLLLLFWGVGRSVGRLWTREGRPTQGLGLRWRVVVSSLGGGKGRGEGEVAWVFVVVGGFR